MAKKDAFEDMERPQRPDLMEAREFEVLRFHLGPAGHPYPVTWLADALGVSRRSVYRWMDPDDDHQVPSTVARLMRTWYHEGGVKTYGGG